MNNFALEVWDDETRFVTYYTVRVRNHQDTETDKFFKKISADEVLKPSLQEIIALLFDQMGNRFGAEAVFFSRQENHAQALPPSHVKLHSVQLKYPEHPLRLYCYRYSNNLVILFNGGKKTAATAQMSPDLSMPFQQANNFVKAIERALRDGLIEVSQDGRYLTDDSGNTDQITL